MTQEISPGIWEAGAQAALEGALMLCRARGEIGPLDSVGAELAAFVGR